MIRPGRVSLCLLGFEAFDAVDVSWKIPIVGTNDSVADSGRTEMVDLARFVAPDASYE